MIRSYRPASPSMWRDLRAMIHQLGENAAKAAERVAVLEAALCEALDALKFQPYRNTRTLQAIPRVEAALTEQPK